MMNGNSTSFLENLVLDDSDKGVIVTGIRDESIATKSGLKAGDEIVAATIHLDHLNKDEVLSILKVLEPYDNNMKVLTKKDLSATAGLGSLGFGLNDSAKIADLNKDLSLDASAQAPVLSIDGLRGKLNASKGLEGGLRGPTMNGDLPSLSLNKPSADASTKFTMPSLGLTGPNVTGDLDGTLKAPNVSVSTLNVDVTKPEIKTGNLQYNSPKFSMPHFDLPQLSPPHANVGASGDIDVPAFGTPDPKLNLKSRDMDLDGPKLNLNGLDVNLGKTDIEPPSGKIKWPHQKWKGAKVKGLDGNLNADLSAPGVNLSTPKFDGNLEAPDVDINLPKAEMEAPEVGAQIPNIDIDAPSGKINWPHKKWKKPNFHGSNADLDLDANLNTPDVDLSLPKVGGGVDTPDVDLNLTKADLEVPNLDADASIGKINWPHLKWKKPKVQGPKADLDIDADLNTPDVQLSSPNITVPNAELNVPDINAPDVDFDAPSGKINWPHKKWKKPKFHGPKADLDLNADLNTPDVGLSVPNFESDISTPDIDLNLPKADVNIDQPSGKVKFPTLKKPKFMLSGPKVKSPDVDIHADTPGLNLDPDIDLNLPNVKAPDANIEAPSGKIKWPTLKKPKFGTLKGPKADLNTDLSAPDVNLSGPNIKGGLDTPDLDFSLPNADVKGLDVDLNGPDLDTPDGKLKFPTFKLPKFKGLNAKGPELDTDLNVPVIEAQDLSLSAPKIEGGIDTLDCDISLPKADLKSPNVDLQAPDIDASAGKIKMPKIKFPTFGLSGPKVKGPNIDVDTDLRSPDLGLSLPDVDAKLPKADLTAPDLNLEAPKIKGGIAAPDWNLKAPDVDVKTPDVDIDAPGKFKMPSFSLPKWNIGGSKAQLPDAELTTPGVSVPDVDVNLPSADVKTPMWNLSAPTIKGDLDADLKTDLPDLKLSTPNINAKGDLGLPKAGLKVPDLSRSSPNIDGNFSAPNIDTKLPKAQLDAPDVNINGPDAKLNKPAFNSPLGDLKLPFKIPKFGLSKSEVEVPSVHPSAEAGMDAPKVNIGNITADANMSALKLDTSLNTETDGSGDEMEIPAFRSHRLPRHGIDGSESNDIFGLSKPVTDEKDYVFSKGIRLPILNAKSAGGEKIDIMERLKMAMQKGPSPNVTPTEVKTDIDLKLAAPSLDASASTEAEDSFLVRGGTFKVDKLESALGLAGPEILKSDENDKMSLSLSNMLGLNVKV
ncbi:neuroblast differentiation-associated protein AHNAK [Platichthys flesus]|uniref:neuroblast differentiation-associated protein AHNAK n=1 Tax=Platichthys flesus TaxID=8260 RepID=UPI002DBD461E|nr:neuroblast differentiation-associated protein AHNAK [Platichthys flesus]